MSAPHPPLRGPPSPRKRGEGWGEGEMAVAHSHPNQEAHALPCQAVATCPLYTVYRFHTKHFSHPCTLPLVKMVWSP